MSISFKQAYPAAKTESLFSLVLPKKMYIKKFLTFARIFTSVPVNTILMVRSNMSVIIYIGLLWWLGVMIMMQDK